MRILLSPMSAMARTAGPFSRVKALALACEKAGMEVALCAAQDNNYTAISHVREYPLDVPMPLGLPPILAVHTYPLAEKLGIMGHKTVHSFEEVLHLTGTTDYSYLEKSVQQERFAIRDFKPDIVYSEFSLPAAIAAQAESVPLACTRSYPASVAFASSPQYAQGVNRLLQELKLPPVTSCLELLDRAALRVVPSIRKLEPVEGAQVLFTGPFEHKAIPAFPHTVHEGCIVIYMGTGTISAKKLIRVVTEAFESSEDAPEVFLACDGVLPFSKGKIYVAPHFDFAALLPKATAFINHGGQNSIMAGLRNGVPQLICPGRIFERRYNAKSVSENGAGITLELPQFTANGVRTAVKHLTTDRCYRTAAATLGDELATLGGSRAVVSHLLGLTSC
ncbi:MAG: UDP-glucoronosyl and UDP-glucosyl transferase [Faecalibacterium sp.]|nr:UDP-glucoronosyl and UDP-glucosyl transferase [Faecalibacterium sp.]